MSEYDEDLNPKGRGLGRGLDALFGDDEDEYHLDTDNDILSDIDDVEDFNERDTSRKIVGVEQLFPCEDQPRKNFDPKSIEELAESIEEHGMIQPILVRPDHTRKDMYEIVAGERRWRAAQRVQLHEVPIIVRDLEDDKMFQIALVENLQRRDLDAIEEARGYQRLIDQYGHSAEKVGQAVGKSRSYVSNMTRLLGLPESVQDMLEKEELTVGHARALLSCEQPTLLAQEIVRNQLSVRETEKLVADNQDRPVRKNKSSKNKGFSEKDADTLALEKELSDQLGMNVAIDMKNDSKGTMKIEFRTLDQLDDVLQRLAQTPKK